MILLNSLDIQMKKQFLKMNHFCVENVFICLKLITLASFSFRFFKNIKIHILLSFSLWYHLIQSLAINHWWSHYLEFSENKHHVQEETFCHIQRSICFVYSLKCKLILWHRVMLLIKKSSEELICIKRYALIQLICI